MAVYGDGRELIESGSCDAVLIATPHYLHPELVICALEWQKALTRTGKPHSH